MRYAIVHGTGNVAAYLPANYSVVATDVTGWAIIAGADRAGWTLDAYVAPRLASGLMRCDEIGADEVAAHVPGFDRPDMTDGPGKFQGQPTSTEYLYRATLDGTDAEAGTVDTGGWYGAVNLRNSDDDDPAAIMQRDADEGGDLAWAGAFAIAGAAWAIVCEDSQGFVSSALFPDDDAFMAAWGEIERMTADDE